jgi:hypothetical protein
MDNRIHIHQFKQKIFKYISKKLRINIQYLVILTSDLKPYHMIIWINENLFGWNIYVKLKKRILNKGINPDKKNIT